MLHSDEYRNAMLKVLNEANDPREVTVSQLEKIVGKIFEVNRVIFSNDELPMEGTGHNWGLYITMKCEYFYVTRVMIDGGFGVNIYPLCTLQKLNISIERIRPNNIYVRAFDGAKTDSIGEVELMLTIGPVEFIVEFQVLNIDASSNILLGRSCIHKVGAVTSTLHQMIKFERDKQEGIIPGKGALSVYRESPLPFVETNNVESTLVYQSFNAVPVEHIGEGHVIPGPQLSPTSLMMVNEMLKYGFKLGKGLGVSLHGIVLPVCPRENLGGFGLGFKPTVEDWKKAKKQKKETWSLPHPVPLPVSHLLKAILSSTYKRCKLS
ncbi:uncharacterized protein LOC107851708 [Capsicum annuum]|uniref:uncharacterized protein LOC107851708 n=1 Tax=Capsicum annuum TaxID=4072 RepID=UPI001FB0E96E|nr:uncharacterized protein LOC107851708 [Capsicum annuum]XP_047256721.1 uncharacterized protein LOC107851708 [Capsicum annuum]XP_047256722.1 uncharacterized protein LOC107851708 [Capsicum annuum]XP_047256723.1 uncharacterized protein LOC107851708 [Capsicum annuum]XP_047256724.1 uncharacterized protein LOC107851708 [Capsicum annuum]